MRYMINMYFPKSVIYGTNIIYKKLYFYNLLFYIQALTIRDNILSLAWH